MSLHASVYYYKITLCISFKSFQDVDSGKIHFKIQLSCDVAKFHIFFSVSKTGRQKIVKFQHGHDSHLK